MRGALEPGAARPLKDGRKAYGWPLVFGPVEPETHDQLMRMHQDVIEHALGERDAKLAIDRGKYLRNLPVVGDIAGKDQRVCQPRGELSHVFFETLTLIGDRKAGARRKTASSSAAPG